MAETLLPSDERKEGLGEEHKEVNKSVETVEDRHCQENQFFDVSETSNIKTAEQLHLEQSPMTDHPVENRRNKKHKSSRSCSVSNADKDSLSDKPVGVPISKSTQPNDTSTKHKHFGQLRSTLDITIQKNGSKHKRNKGKNKYPRETFFEEDLKTLPRHQRHLTHGTDKYLVNNNSGSTYRLPHHKSTNEKTNTYLHSSNVSAAVKNSSQLCHDLSFSMYNVSDNEQMSSESESFEERDCLSVGETTFFFIKVNEYSIIYALDLSSPPAPLKSDSIKAKKSLIYQIKKQASAEESIDPQITKKMKGKERKLETGNDSEETIDTDSLIRVLRSNLLFDENEQVLNGTVNGFLTYLIDPTRPLDKTFITTLLFTHKYITKTEELIEGLKRIYLHPLPIKDPVMFSNHNKIILQYKNAIRFRVLNFFVKWSSEAPAMLTAENIVAIYGFVLKLKSSHFVFGCYICQCLSRHSASLHVDSSSVSKFLAQEIKVSDIEKILLMFSLDRHFDQEYLLMILRGAPFVKVRVIDGVKYPKSFIGQDLLTFGSARLSLPQAHIAVIAKSLCLPPMQILRAVFDSTQRNQMDAYKQFHKDSFLVASNPTKKKTKLFRHSQILGSKSTTNISEYDKASPIFRAASPEPSDVFAPINHSFSVSHDNITLASLSVPETEIIVPFLVYCLNDDCNDDILSNKAVTDMGLLTKTMSSSFDFLSIHPIEFARQLTLFQSLLLKKVTLHELSNPNWERDENTTESPNVMRCLDHSKQFQSWIVTDLLNYGYKSRVTALTRLIDVAFFCEELGNLNAIFDIAFALNQPSIVRMNKTISGLSVASRRKFDDLKQYTSWDQNFNFYRTKLAQVLPPFVPSFSMTFRDIARSDDSPTWINEEHTRADFEKLRCLANVIQIVNSAQKCVYQFAENTEITKFLPTLNGFSSPAILMAMSQTQEK